MRRTLPPLRSIRAFETAARHESFLKAAEELNVTPSAVSQQIRELEARLGVKLFVRKLRSVELTQNGRRYAEELRSALDCIGYATIRAMEEDGKGRLAISTTPSLAGSWLIHRLKRFQNRFPDYDVVLSATYQPARFDQDQIDIAVHYGLGPPGGAHAELLHQPMLCAVCSPSLLTMSGGLCSPDDLRRHTLLRLTDSEADAWLVGVGVIVPQHGPRYSDTVLLMQAARDGQGVALVHHFLAADDIAQGRLAEPFDARVPARGAYYLVTSPGGLQRPKVKVFADWLKEQIQTELSGATAPPPGVSTESYADRLFEKFGRRPVVATSVVQFDNATVRRWMDAMQAAAALHGMELMTRDGQNDARIQAAHYDYFIARRVDLILVDPVDAKAIVPVVKRINDAGIPVINFDAPAAGGQFATFVGMDWLQAGILSGLQIVAATGGKGSVVLVEGTPGFAAQFLRTRGIKLVLSAYPKINIIATEPGMFNRVDGLKATEQLLRAHPHIDAWYFQNDEMFLGGIEAIRAAGRRGEMKILSVDGNPEALKAIGAGDLDYELVCGFNLQGWLVMEAAAKVLMGEAVPDKVVVPLSMMPDPGRPTHQIAS